jgi:hypothetical protein
MRALVVSNQILLRGLKMQNNYFLSFVLVVISGLVWSLSAPLFRLLEDAEHY